MDLVESRVELQGILDAAMGERVGHYLVATNPEKLMRVQKDEALRQILSESSANYADGVGVIWAVRLLCRRSIERITGVALFSELLAWLNRKEGSLFLYGGTKEVNQQAAKLIGKQFGSLRVIGSRDGYSSDGDSVAQEIRKLQPDLTVVALGSPGQEKWIFRYGRTSGSRLLLGVGGSLDVLVGKVRRAPQWVRHLGLEWLYRLLAQPSRWSRQKVLPVFVLSVFVSYIGNLFTRRGASEN